jgi:hypothetical protein
MNLRFVSLKFAVFAALLLNLLASPTWAADDLTGSWTGKITDPMGSHPIELQLKVEGSKITGTLTGGPPTGEALPIREARLEGDQLSFKVKVQDPQGEDHFLVYKGKVTGNHIQGTQEAPFGSVPWEVTKK